MQIKFETKKQVIDYVNELEKVFYDRKIEIEDSIDKEKKKEMDEALLKYREFNKQVFGGVTLAEITPMQFYRGFKLLESLRD